VTWYKKQFCPLGLEVKLAAFWPICLRASRKYTSTRSFSRFHKSPNRVTMNWSATVLSTVTSDTEPTIVLNFDSAKYVFNVGENTNRAFLQSKRNWRKARGVFLTSIGTQRASGLPGEFLCGRGR
jgi:tRNase Z endonuclease